MMKKRGEKKDGTKGTQPKFQYIQCMHTLHMDSCCPQNIREIVKYKTGEAHICTLAII